MIRESFCMHGCPVLLRICPDCTEDGLRQDDRMDINIKEIKRWNLRNRFRQTW